MDPAILFVDDNASLLEFLSEVFSQWSYSVFVAASGEVALDIIENNEIHLAVIDQEMPEMRGIELLGILKKKYPDIVRILMTGYSDQQSAIDAINTGQVFRFVRKPFTPNQIKGIVDEALDEFDKTRQRSELFRKMEKLTGESRQSDVERQSAESPGLIIIQDPGHQVIEMNDVVKEAFGLSETDTPPSIAEVLPANRVERLWYEMKKESLLNGVCRRQLRFSDIPKEGIYELILIPTNETALGEQRLFKLLILSRQELNSSEITLFNYVQDLENASALKDKGLNFLYDMSKQIGTTHNIEELVQTIFLDLKDVIAFDIGMLATMREGQTRLYAHSSYAVSEKVRASLRHEIQEQYLSLTSTTLYDGQLNFQIKDWEGNPLDTDAPVMADPINATITLPLENTDDDVIGIIYIGSFSKSAYSREELRIFATFSNRIALMIHIINSIFEYKEMQKIANRDSLTGLLNRRSFQDILTEEIARSRRFHKSLSLLMLDIDYFKKINDTFGHLNGDEVLKEISQIISKTMRSIDKVFRYGGEEFIILLPETNVTGAAVIAERLRNKIQNNEFIIIGEVARDTPPLFLTVSIGISWTSTPEESGVQQLVDQCDKALYYAKQHGRNRVVKFSEISNILP